MNIGLVRSNVGQQRPPIYPNNAVANAQAGALRRAPFHHIFDCLTVLSLVILRVMLVIEAELHLRMRPTNRVHPEGTVSDRSHGKQGCQCCQEWFSERRAPTHDVLVSASRRIFPANPMPCFQMPSTTTRSQSH